MSEQYEPSYYEIALTGRQVLVAFVILLVCLVAAFFSGVWVGRGSPGRMGGIPAVETASEGGVQAAGEIGTTPPEEEEIAALSFFDEEAGGAPSGEPASGSAAAGRTTGGGTSEPAAGQAASPPPSPSPAGDRGPAAEQAPAQETDQGADRTPGESAERPERPRETVNPSGSLTGGDVVIQVFSSADETKAREILDRLKANDFRAFISPVTDGGRTLYRVRVGPFEHQDDAERVAAELRRQLDLDTWITR